MFRAKTTILGTLAVLGLAAGIAGCQRGTDTISWQASGVPHHEHSAESWWSYQFVYHPRAQVYYEPYSETFYWFASGAWEQGPDLPLRISIDGDTARVVKLQHEKPYRQHASVVATNHPGITPLPGSLDPYHCTPEAIALSEQRAAIRTAGTMEQLMDAVSTVPPAFQNQFAPSQTDAPQPIEATAPGSDLVEDLLSEQSVQPVEEMQEQSASQRAASEVEVFEDFITTVDSIEPFADSDIDQ